MSKDYDDLLKHMAKYLETKQGFGILHLAHGHGTEIKGDIMMGFPKNSPFMVGHDGVLSLRPVDHYGGELERLQAIHLHQEELMGIMKSQCNLYQALVSILSLYDSFVGSNSFNDSDIADNEFPTINDKVH